MGRHKRMMLSGQRAAVFGLLLAGCSTFTIGNMLGIHPRLIRRELPSDWVPPQHGHRKVPKSPKVPRRKIDKNAIVAAYVAGWHTLQEMAEQFDCTREYVRQVLCSRGISERTQGRLAPAILNQRLQRYLKALERGISSKEAETASGVTHKEARHAAQTLGHEPPKFIRPGRIRYGVLAAFYEANPGMTGSAVAKHFDVSPNTLSKALRVMGVRARHSGWTHAHKSSGPKTDIPTPKPDGQREGMS